MVKSKGWGTKGKEGSGLANGDKPGRQWEPQSGRTEPPSRQRWAYRDSCVLYCVDDNCLLISQVACLPDR